MKTAEKVDEKRRAEWVKWIVMNSRGYTLLELLIVLVVLSILASATVPNLQESLRRNARESVMLDLMSSLAMARSEAVTSGINMTVCRSVDLVDCAGVEGADWDAGWIVFSDGDTAGTVDGDDTVLRIQGAMAGLVAITLADGTGADMTDEIIQFNDDGFLENSTNGAYFKFCPPDNTVENARAVWVANTGRSSMSIDNGDGVHNDYSGDDLVCP